MQSSTRNILSSYRERAELLRECSEDVKLLIREGYDLQIALSLIPPYCKSSGKLSHIITLFFTFNNTLFLELDRGVFIQGFVGNDNNWH